MAEGRRNVQAGRVIAKGVAAVVRGFLEKGLSAGPGRLPVTSRGQRVPAESDNGLLKGNAKSIWHARGMNRRFEAEPEKGKPIARLGRKA